MTSAIEIDYSGPILTDRTAPIVAQMLDEAAQEVAAQASADIHDAMNRTFRHPTPYYETQVNIARRGYEYVVNDRGVVYGPWLEGVGSRNATSTFKGYANWRRTRAGLDTKIPKLIDHVMRRFLGRLG